MPPTPTATESAPAGAPLLSVRDLRVSFFMDEGVVRAVDGVSFDVFPGQVVGIVGRDWSSSISRWMIRSGRPPQ